jgi:hypothetical protein
MRKKILFICGSINQTSQMHKISMHLPEYDHFFTPYYADGFVRKMKEWGLLDFTVLGNKLAGRCLAYLRTHDLRIDYGGTAHSYDLVLTCSDLVVPGNIRDRRVILVQEGMTDPENLLYHIVKALRLPRYLASTAMTGLSMCYDYFCVASEGYRDLFINKGVDPATLRVTGIPNFDNCAEFLANDFPHHDYVLVATSDARETFKYENRRKFIAQCVDIAGGRQLIFKLHPNEKVARATAEINRWAPGALVFTSGNTDHMIANCDVLVTKYSSVVYAGIALGKEVYSYFDLDSLHRLAPRQNGGTSARAIAEVCRHAIEDLPVPATYEELMAASDPLVEHAFHSTRSYSK